MHTWVYKIGYAESVRVTKPTNIVSVGYVQLTVIGRQTEYAIDRFGEFFPPYAANNQNFKEIQSDIPMTSDVLELQLRITFVGEAGLKAITMHTNLLEKRI